MNNVLPMLENVRLPTVGKFFILVGQISDDQDYKDICDGWRILIPLLKFMDILLYARIKLISSSAMLL